MKYIRTKEGVYELTEKQNNIENCYNVKIFRENPLLISRKGYRIVAKDRVVASADTIEELCDEFVCDNKVFHTIKELRAYRCNSDISAFGAIWTDKGLQYVTKMNDKGKLELL